MRTALFKKC